VEESVIKAVFYIVLAAFYVGFGFWFGVVSAIRLDQFIAGVVG
jgi:hypothetical protein